MKNSILIAACFCVLLTGSPACNNWNETEAIVFVKEDGQTDEYYAALRQWKADIKHDIAFGWYGFWSGTGTSLNNSMIGVPDSVHIISVWGPWMPSTLSPNKKKDMAFVQRVKGTKVLATTITGWVGTGLTTNMYDYDQKEQLWGWEKDWNSSKTWKSTDPEIRARQEASIRKYARAIVDSILLAGYDGYDIDYEPTIGGTGCRQELSDKDNVQVMVDELGKYLGPKSGTNKMLVIDGEVHNIHAETSVYFDYFIEQAYGSSSDASLNTRFKRVVAAYDGILTPEEVAAKYIVTTNFESYAPTGGGKYTRPDGTSTYQLRGFAEWKPSYNDETFEKKGGFGAYHMEMEYTVSGKEGFYPYYREAIQAAHPSVQQ